MARKSHGKNRRMRARREVHHPYDQCFKSVMNRRLARRARVALERSVHVPPQRIDVAYEPLAPAPELGLELGILGQMMALGSGMLEYFAQCPSPDAVEECLRKRLNYAHERMLAARELGDPVPARPWLWILSAGQPLEALEACGAEPLVGWPAGFWQSRTDAWTRIVVLSELPESPDTLLLRIFGRGRTLVRALTELNDLPEDDELRQAVMPALLAFRGPIMQDLKRTGDMNAAEQVQALYEAWEKRTIRKGLKKGLKEGLKEGLEQGRAEAMRQVLVDLLTQRFGSLPRDASERIQQADTATLERWVGRVLPAASLGDVLA
jgi:hypothetical protein